LVLASEDAIHLALHAPDSDYIIVGAGQHAVASVVPLDTVDVVRLVRPLWLTLRVHRAILGDVSELD
jgi:hypothetical protein